MNPLESEILFHQDGIIAVNKPGGVLTQAPPGIDSMQVRIARWLARGSSGELPYVGVPHRLDRPASGVMLMTGDRQTARYLSRQFERRQIGKQYWVLVEGNLEQDAGCWEDWMRKIPSQAKSEIVAADHPDAQSAVLHFYVLHRHAGRILLEVQLQTGRTHQIRLQCSARGFPIIGDQLYGSRSAFGPQTADQRERWIGLHARSLTFRLRNGASQQVIAPVAEWWPICPSGF